ncbi:MAG: SHOCT-like domain-containing protein [Holdemania massiliensis]
MNSREKIMEMVKDGTLSVEEGLRLLDAIEESSGRKTAEIR